MAMCGFEARDKLPTVPTQQRPINHGDMKMLLFCGVHRLIRTRMGSARPKNATMRARGMPLKMLRIRCNAQKL
jgi:hypothetical protein